MACQLLLPKNFFKENKKVKMESNFKNNIVERGVPIPEATRLKIWERCGGRCEYCGKKAIDPHHIIYRSQGGSNEEKNLIALCRLCHNSQKVKDKVLKNPLNYIGRYKW